MRSPILCLAFLPFIALPLWAAQSVPLSASQQEYWSRFDQQDWDQAIAAAELLVAAARPASPENALRLGEALSLLGNAQLAKGNLVAAEAAFMESLQLLEAQVSESSSRLVDPLRGMGYTLAAENNHAQAIPYLDRALILSRRNAGLFDIGQQGLLRQLATSRSALGQSTEAERHMIYLLRVGQHAYGSNDPRFAQLLCVVGDWYMEVGQLAPARQHFRTALAIIERKLGENDLAVVEPLRALAQTYPREVFLSGYGIQTRVERMPSNVDGTSTENAALNPRNLGSDGERALLRAIRILDSHEDRSNQTLLETLVQMGDWFQLAHQPGKALPYYERALTVPADDKSVASGATLSFPVQVYYPTPSIATRNLTRPASEVEERYVQVEFTVRADGSVTDAHVTEQNATERQIAQTLEAIRAARYRPRFMAGKPIDTPAMSYRQIFKERKEEKTPPP